MVKVPGGARDRMGASGAVHRGRFFGPLLARALFRQGQGGSRLDLRSVPGGSLPPFGREGQEVTSQVQQIPWVGRKPSIAVSE